MKNEPYRNHHYVPQWYQDRFIPSQQAQRDLFYRDLAPEPFKNGQGVSIPWDGIRSGSTKRCFMEPDLYTRHIGGVRDTDIERSFFGTIDAGGKRAVEAFSRFSPALVQEGMFHSLLLYMGTQKLRTPKGLAWLGTQARSQRRDDILRLMVVNREQYSAVWSECVWLIADAITSDTKFIVSDNPVTVYNRSCGPRSDWCRGVNDPDVRLNATQTIFPLSLDKVLLLTNLSWARNPYQRATALRPNPKLSRVAYFNLMDVQVERHLSEREVLEINFIIKSRAMRYIAAGKREWLFPEHAVSKSS